ncbi:GGDEF domain-containing protein [Kibdelosporangium philippinense]|uniref:GGDEF domain-containing protein n=1 Tax=Kibdelosporangium philippinense TaxID=211113 RepID=A0ABS8ZI93_9PSEU|nr:GGDEF domain-containing protein [Kibdelosporangium philippinense]MCE7006356.1 GGDEF domain-containing protein [Kibdelosporangium philippinense]
MNAGGVAAPAIGFRRPTITIRRWSLPANGVPVKTVSLVVLTAALLTGLGLAWSTTSWLTAVVLTLCGIAYAEFARSRDTDTAAVSAAPVWLIGAVLTLPLGAVFLVSAVLLGHELLRGQRPVLTSLAGATVAWLAWSSVHLLAPVDVMSTPTVLAAGMAGLLYLAVTDGPALMGVTRRLIHAVHPVEAGHGVYGLLVTRVALGVLLGVFGHFSFVAIPFFLLPVAYLQRSMRGRALQHAAAHDAKTQLWNHAAWQTLSTASHRTHARSAVLMVDLDHFKRLNDTYGHHAGDDVLASVAHILQTTTRRHDIVARFGGEEFSILLPGATEQEANEAAERIRHQIEALTVITTNLHGRPTTISGITASIGVATTRHAEVSVDDMLLTADRCLYQAKELGRNRVCGPTLAVAA